MAHSIYHMAYPLCVGILAVSRVPCAICALFSLAGCGGVAASTAANDAGDAGSAAEGGADASPACDGGDSVQFARDVAPLFRHNCGAATQCHGADLLTPANAYAMLVSKPSTECADGRLLVTPGDPSRSYLMDKLEGTNMCSGARMPEVFAYLSDGDVGLVRAWICAGAPND
jgi:hypothetical protein